MATGDQMAKDAIKVAANYLTTKVEKHHKKHTKHIKEGKDPEQGSDGYTLLTENAIAPNKKWKSR